MKTKAKDRIRLSSGETITLGEALDLGKLFLKVVEHWPRHADKSVDRWIARETQGDLFWEVGKTLYESRTGSAVSVKSGKD